MKNVASKRTKMFLIMGLIGLFAVLTGFSTTFIIPLSKGTFKAPFAIYFHGALAFSWVLLFIAQAWLIQRHQYAVHRRLGIMGLVLAIAITLTLIPAGLYQTERELQLGLGQTAISSFLGTLTSGLVFIALVITAIIKRREPSTHKRLMLLATLVLLWPAWFRFRHLFPSIPNPEIWFAFVLADSFIIISILWDRLSHGKFHYTLSIIGLLVILEHTIEVAMFDSPVWRNVAHSIYTLFNV